METVVRAGGFHGNRCSRFVLRRRSADIGQRRAGRPRAALDARLCFVCYAALRVSSLR